jgi:CRP-like cAMP-binding protein
METTMYDNLLLLPLFQGLSKADFTTILEKVRIHFLTYQEGETFIQQGEDCQQLCFLLNGKAIVRTTDKNRNYTLSETFEAPAIIEPQSLFGMHPHYTATYQAQTLVKVLTIDKAYIFTELNKHEIFRLNFLNILSNRVQTAYQKLWDNHIGSLNEKLVHFIAIRSLNPGGERTLQITMEDWAGLIDETRINLSRLLNELQTVGLVQLKRKEFYIPDFEKLTNYLIEHD